MTITNFGIIWLIVLLIASFNGIKSLTKVLFVSCIFQAGAVFIIGKSVLPPLTVSCIFYCTISLLRHIRRNRFQFPSCMNTYYLMWAILVVTSLLASTLFVGTLYLKSLDWVEYDIYDGHVAFFGLFSILIYGITALMLYNEKPISDKELYHIMVFMTVFIFIISCWQYISVFYGISRNNFIANLIYSNTVSESIGFYNSLKNTYSNLFDIRLHSTFMEPSYCAGFLSCSFFYLFSKNKHSLMDKILILILVGMIILTFSATAYAAFAFACFLSFIISGRTKAAFALIFKIVLFAILSMALITYMDLWNTIDRMIFQKGDSHSAYIRNLWNMNCINIFQTTYGLGMGYASVRGSSLLLTLLGTFGIIGTFLYLRFIFLLIKSRYQFTYNTSFLNESKVLKCMIISAISTQFIAIPNFDYPIFWMTIFILFSRVNSRYSNTPKKVSHA